MYYSETCTTASAVELMSVVPVELHFFPLFLFFSPPAHKDERPVDIHLLSSLVPDMWDKFQGCTLVCKHDRDTK